ncbi:MAG: DNA gyrase inhibitor YacG [Reyranellaceae bacterium]
MSKSPRLRLVKPAACPICGKEQVEPFRPFCSKRCAEIDMGRWLKGGYAIPGEPVPEDGGGNGEDQR